MLLHSKEQIKELSNQYDYSQELEALHNKFSCTANLLSEMNRIQMILDEELSKYKRLIGTHVSYKGIFAKEAKTGTITEILHFYHSSVIVRIDYDTNGFDHAPLTNLICL